MHGGSAPDRVRAARLAEVWRRLKGACDPACLAWLGVALGAVTLGGLAASLGPLALKRLVDGLAAVSAPRQLAGLVGLYVATLLSQRLCEQLQTFAYARGEQRLTRRFGGQAFAHMLALPLSFHHDTKSGALAQSLAEGVIGLRLILTHAALTLAPVVVQIAVAGVVMAAAINGPVAWTLLAALAAYAAAFAWGVARLDAPARGISASQIDVGGAIADSLMNVETIKAFTAERRFVGRYDRLLGETQSHWRVFLRRRLENGVVVAIVFALAIGAVDVLAGLQVGASRLTLGGFVLVNAYLLQLVRPLEMLGFGLRDIAQGLAHLDKLAAILTRPGEEIGGHDANAYPEPDAPAELEFDRVSLDFGDRRALHDISFRAPPGARIGIVGPSGAGKSSLLRLILRFFDPDSGQIRFDGRPLADHALHDLRRQIAWVSQDTILFNDTIGQNIALAADAVPPGAIAAAADLARLSSFLAELPDGLDTRVGERGLKLSGGEKQRVSIARAALKRARLVIFDEATAALDPQTERAVWQAMGDLARGATTLVVTHRLSTVVSADEILVLDHGRIVERGDHSTLLAAGGLYAGLWRSQQAEARAAAPAAEAP